MAVLLAVALLGRLLPLQWMRRRSIGRFLLCSAAVAGLAWLLSMGLWQNVDRAADDSLGVLAPTLFIALFLLPGEVLMAILSAILNSRGGGGGGGSGGGGIFRGGGGSSGGGGASGRW